MKRITLDNHKGHRDSAAKLASLREELADIETELAVANDPATVAARHDALAQALLDDPEAKLLLADVPNTANLATRMSVLRLAVSKQEAIVNAARNEANREVSNELRAGHLGRIVQRCRLIAQLLAVDAAEIVERDTATAAGVSLGFVPATFGTATTYVTPGDSASLRYVVDAFRSGDLAADDEAVLTLKGSALWPSVNRCFDHASYNRPEVKGTSRREHDGHVQAGEVRR